MCNIGEAFSSSGPSTLNVNQPAFVQDFLGPGRNLPLRQTPDSAPRLEGWPLAAPRVYWPATWPPCDLMLPFLFSLRLQAAPTGSESRAKQDWTRSWEQALPQATSVSGSSLKD